MKYLVIISLLLFTACGKDPERVTEYVNVPVSESSVEPSIQDQIDEVVDYKNAFRDASGLVPLMEGLTCTLHNAASGDLDVSFGTAAYTYSMHADFNQSEIDSSTASNILPEALRSLYIGLNYSLRCQGYIVVLDSERYQFTLSSDDGSRLWVNNTLVIDNEGTHAIFAKSGSIVLERGVYAFRLDYSQSGGGNQGLILTESGEVVDNAFFYR